MIIINTYFIVRFDDFRSLICSRCLIDRPMYTRSFGSTTQSEVATDNMSEHQQISSKRSQGFHSVGFKGRICGRGADSSYPK